MIKKLILAISVFLLACLPACTSPLSSTATTSSPSPAATSPKPTSTTTILATPVNQFQASYRLLEKYPDYFWCDPDFFPVGRPGVEESNSTDQFSTIRSNTQEFAAIRENLKLADRAEYSDLEKLNIYREHKKLTRALQVVSQGDSYQFTLRIGQNQGFRIEGSVFANGSIVEIKREASFNTCPICLSAGTLIETPNGAIPVEKLLPGMLVSTYDTSGRRRETRILRVSTTAVPVSFLMVKITLSDGRWIMASPGHPTAESKALADYKVGEVLDGGMITYLQLLPYLGEATYDILPGEGEGLYRANGILLGSTLK